MNPSFPNIAITPIAPKENIAAPNLPFTPEVVNYGYPSTGEVERPLSLIDELNAKANAIPIDKNVSPVYKTEGMDLSGRFPKVYLEGDNEEIYAQGQTTGEKAWNGVVKMSGLATSAFINGTAGIVYGTGEAIRTGKFSSFYDNDLSRSLNEWTESLENSYAHYKTLREREGHWWEPENLFTGNFLFDNIVKNLGFSLGSFAAGGAWGAALKAVGLTSRLVASGAETAAKAEQIIGQAATLPEAERIAYTVGKLEQLYNSVERGRKIERGIVATTGSFGEGGLEALNNSQQFRDSMIENYKRTYGYAPSTQELKEIDTYAQNVGNWSLALNVALLSATQYIQLPKILNSSYKSEKGIINDVIFKEGKYVSNLPEAGAGKFLYKAYKGAGILFNKEESFEEGMQFAIQAGTQNYFDKKFNDEDPSVLEDGILKGFKETLTSDEGLLNVVTGGLSGGLMTSGIMTGGQKVGPFSGGLINQRGFLGYGGESKIKREEIINEFNKSLLTNKLKEGFNNVKAAEKIQEQRTAAIRQGDVLESKDLEFDYAHAYIETRLKYGAKESIDFEINDLRKQAITEDGFPKLQQEGRTAKDDTKETFLARLDNLQEHANNVFSIYNGLSTSLSGIVLRNKAGEVVLDKDGKPVRKYSDKSIQMLTYAASKVKDYDKRLQQLSSELLSTGVSTSALIAAAGNTEEFVKILKEQQALVSSTDELNQEENLQKLNDVAEIALRRKNFINEYKDIQTNPQKWDTTQPVTEKETITVTDKEGEREVNVGEEYYLGEIEYVDKDGVRRKRFPKLTILGENPDGTIKIKDSKGIRDINKEELASYKLGKVADVEKSENSSFYFRNVVKQPDNVFYWNIGKKKASKEFPDGVITGTLKYDGKNDKLYFVYTQNGKQKVKEVGLDQFKPKEGFKQGVFYSKNELTQQDIDNINKRESSGKTKEDIEARRGDKLRVLNTLYQGIIEKSSKVNDLLEKKRVEFENISKDLQELEDRILSEEETFDKRFKKPTFKKSLKEALVAAERLQKTKDQLEFEILELEEQKATLDMEKEDILPYIEDMSQNIDELPAGNKEFLEELKEQKQLLEEAISATEEQLSSIQSLAKKVQETLDSAIGFIADLIDKFKEKYPKAPLAIVAQEWIDFLQANPNFLKRKPDYKSDLKQLEELVAQVEDLDVIPTERHLKELNQSISELQEELKVAQNRLKTIEKVIDKFEEIAKKNQEIKEQQEAIIKNEALQNELLGTNNKREQVVFDEGASTFEVDNKKSTSNVINSTITSSKFDQPHHVRANNFGFRFRTMSSAKKAGMKIVALTQQTEAQLGLSGLTQMLKDEGAAGIEVDPTTTIVGVITKNGKLVDEFGETFELADDASNIKRAVFQVFPLEKLTAKYPSGEGTMFRANVSEEERKFYEAEYANWRKATLAKTAIDENDYEDVDVSFGSGEFIKNRVEKVVDGKPVIVEQIDYTTKTPVENAGLVENTNDFENKPLLTIPTTNDEISEGTTTLKNALGKVFFKLAGVGLERLNNRKLNKKEAQTIFDVILQVCKNEYAKQGKISKEEKDELALTNKRFYQWLDTILYWGIPRNVQTGQRKTPGFNSVWFEKDTDGVVKLFVSGKGTKFAFTPSSLESNKIMIITLLEGMYHDVNAPLVNEYWNKPYTQIVGVENGQPIVKRWKNYQSYLLAETNTETGEKRNSDEIPLSTILRPLADKEDTNRKGIYFIRKPKESKVYKPSIKFTQPKSTTSSQKVSDIQFPTMEQIINAPNEIENKSKRKELKDRWEKLKKLIECI